MKATLLGIMIMASVTIAYEGEEWQEDFRDVFQGNDTLGIQKALFLSNYFGFCILPRTTMATHAFFRAFYRSEKVNETLREKGISEEYLLSKKFSFNEDGSFKIPLKSHRVWVTSP